MLIKKRKTEIDVSKKKLVLEFVSLGLGILLSILAVALIRISYYIEEQWTQSLLLSLGTGAAMSALVSWVFYINDKLVKKRERLNARIVFMNDFKVLYYNFIKSINFDKKTSVTIDTENYIKNQHRWYHEHYKRIVANSENEEERDIRIKQLRSFMDSTKIKFCECFEYNSNWKDGEYSEWQHKELSYIFSSFKNIENYIESEDYSPAFFEFSYFLECLKRMSKEFVELSNFNLLSFTYDDLGNLKINTDKFEANEPMFKFAREFNNIRSQNYKKYYSEKSRTGNDTNTEESV